ncbi:hAT transposon superfamily [Striga asiatica]|uniref:HAT transposon superfamily n=1 Tax=Striga asiatica TaxID=4170 RepID=A0A5A7R0Z4_STRAF|nr:hAT transposon superfamily [Striga asiatica]
MKPESCQNSPPPSPFLNTSATPTVRPLQLRRLHFATPATFSAFVNHLFNDKLVAPPVLALRCSPLCSSQAQFVVHVSIVVHQAALVVRPTSYPSKALRHRLIGMEGSNNEMLSTQSSRGKSDPAWEFVSLIRENGKSTYTCLFCKKQFKGGGIHRMKHHLAGKKGEIAPCKEVSHDVKSRMAAHLDEVKQKKIDPNYDDYEEESTTNAPEEVREVPEPTPATGKGKRKAVAGPVDRYFAPRTTPGSQPGLKSVFATKEAVKNAIMALARWFYANCIPFNATQSCYFQPALDAIAAIGSGFKGPSFNDVRANLLGDCKKECQLLVESYRC